MCEKEIVAESSKFIAVFIDTLSSEKKTQATVKRFKEHWGSYPVLRIHDPHSDDSSQRDLAGRIDGNKVAGQIPAQQVLQQMAQGLATYDKNHPKSPTATPSGQGQKQSP